MIIKNDLLDPITSDLNQLAEAVKVTERTTVKHHSLFKTKENRFKEDLLALEDVIQDMAIKARRTRK